MWTESIIKFRENNKQRLDLKFELHHAIHVEQLLRELITFELDSIETEDVIIKREGVILTKEQFFYWWQITRFDEIISEEEVIFKEFNELKEKLSLAINKVKNPTINANDSPKEKQKKETKITANNEKIQKLNNHLKESADSSNVNINALKGFRAAYPSINSIEAFLVNIKIILMNR
jgi:hypothetical protein